MQYEIIPVTLFSQNCTLFWCEKSKKAVVIDPGGEIPLITQQIDRLKLDVDKILITHGHIDHAGGAAELAELLSVPIYGPHIEDRFWIDKMDEQSEQFGVRGVRSFTPEQWLNDGDQIKFGDGIVLDVIHCPGHTPGHVVFYNSQARLAQVGDVIFQGSIGRTDFPRGDFKALIASIKNKLFPLGDDVRFISGHGPMSTFGEEKQTNPYVGAHARAGLSYYL